MEFLKFVYDSRNKIWLEKLFGGNRISEFKAIQGGSQVPESKIITQIHKYLEGKSITLVVKYRIIDGMYVPIMFHHNDKIFCVVHSTFQTAFPGIIRLYQGKEKEKILEVCGVHSFIVLEIDDRNYQTVIDRALSPDDESKSS